MQLEPDPGVGLVEEEAMEEPVESEEDIEELVESEEPVEEPVESDVAADSVVSPELVVDAIVVDIKEAIVPDDPVVSIGVGPMHSDIHISTAGGMLQEVVDSVADAVVVSITVDPEVDPVLERPPVVDDSIMSPIGIGIGIAITISSNNEIAYYLSVAILQALAGGTILYVVVFEVLERERSKSVSGIAQLMFVIIGFCCMMSVELLGMKNIVLLLILFFIWCQSGIF